jgi:hypothetical protein
MFAGQTEVEMKLAAFCVVALAAGPAFAGLALEVHVEKSEVEFEAPVTLVVRFVNEGDEEVRFFEPLHVGLNTFPDVRLVQKGDGRELKPYDPPFQSMVARGLQGKIVILKAGEKKVYRFVRDRFLAVDRRTQKADWHEPRPLPDGEYELRVGYTRTDRMLPVNVGGFDVEKRETAGIFTGTIAAKPVTFTVKPPTRPHLRITVPDRGKTEVVIVYANPTEKEHVFEGDAAFVLGSKMYGAAHGAAGKAASSVTVPAGGRVERRVELRDLNWIPDRGDGTPEGLGELVPSGLCHLRFEMAGEKPAKSDGIWVPIPRVPTVGMEGLAVAATVRGRTVSVEVDNVGEKDVCIVHRLAFPSEIVLRIEDATGKRHALVSTTGRGLTSRRGPHPRGEGYCRVAKGLSWDREAYDDAGGLTRKDFIWMAPRSAIEKDFDLGKLLAKPLPPGRYHITAGYRNTESGARLGFPKGSRAATGVVWSKPVELVVAGEDE